MAGSSGIPIWQKKTSVITKPIFMKLKGQFCIRCGKELILAKITHYGIKKGSFEAFGKSIRFDIFNHPVDYTFSIFLCNQCGNKLSISDQYFIENPHKKDRRIHDDYHQYLQSIDMQTGGNEYLKYLENINWQRKKIYENI